MKRLLLVLLLLMFTGACDYQPTDDLIGPDEEGNWYAAGMHAGVGEPVSIGNFVRQRRSRRVVLQSVTLTDVHGLDLVGVVVSRRMVGGLRGFPPTEYIPDARPVRGTVVPPHRRDPYRLGVAITFGLRRDAVGVGYATGFDVVYTVDGRLRRRVFRTGLTVCAVAGYSDANVPKQGCPSPDRPTTA